MAQVTLTGPTAGQRQSDTSCKERLSMQSLFSGYMRVWENRRYGGGWIERDKEEKKHGDQLALEGSGRLGDREWAELAS